MLGCFKIHERIVSHLHVYVRMEGLELARICMLPPLFSRAGCDHHFFRQCDAYTTHCCLWDADSEYDIEIFEVEKINRTQI